MFWPMIAHVLLVFSLYALLFYRRKKYSLVDRDAVLRYKERGEEARESLLVNRNIANQFELPVLFHVACLLLYITDADNIVTVVLAWLFVLSRCGHSFVHVTSNSLRYRAPLFAAGFAILVCLWGWLAIWLALE
ncbi:MAPEG family protein [Agrobacterium tumefaciens]|uniref:MAPEG family protein n=1 Tax=Agrobacterium tumefaciens TaxID=358 RepID=UPI00287E70C6|nr:MAPEG family protein [Agrobacterium tumefaciens]MDS7596230.1 MAPEG family protein [Agrobacterium tumefaciens]